VLKTKDKRDKSPKGLERRARFQEEWEEMILEGRDRDEAYNELLLKYRSQIKKTA
jgi:hypothetical protein